LTNCHPDLPHIVFLFSDTGGGHRSAAEAVIEALMFDFPDCLTTQMVDIFRDYAPIPLNFAPDIYPTLTRMPEIWELGYKLSDGKQRVRMANQMVHPYIRRALRKLVSEHPCDLLVSMHQLSNLPFLHVLKDRKFLFTTVVLDLVSTHAAWYDQQADLVIVPTEPARLRGLQLGLREDQMQVVGLPVAQRFCAPPGEKKALRAQLGWLQEKPVVLLVGGGEGMGPVEAMAHAIDAAKLPITLVVIAGRNRSLKERLEAHRWQISTEIYGFVREMPDFMRAADVIITKAGPGTISEAFIAGLPLILYHRLPGQEDGNVTFVVDEEAGVWAPEPDEVVVVLKKWLDHPEEYARVAANARRLARPNAARDIARILARQAGVAC
jgi:1,2-diacylglycerol 3-beta-galactosyltransferase